MGKLSRNKGAAFEREVANLLETIPGVRAKRCLVETREGNVGDIETNLPYVIQCKVGAVPPIYPAVDQAVAAAGSTGKTPVAIIRRNQTARTQRYDLAVLRIEDFLRLVAIERTRDPSASLE